MSRRAITRFALLPALALAATALATASPASADPPTLRFTLNESLTNGSIELGTPNGEPVCTGEGETLACSTPMGISTSYSFNASITEAGTGTAGRLIGSCAVMYAGLMHTFATTTGSYDATGSEDCDLHFTFGPGDEAWGGMHEGRVLSGTVETDTFTLTMTRGIGKFAGLSGVLTMSAPNPWTPPPPIGVASATPTLRATALSMIARAGVHPAQDGPQTIGVPLSKKPVADVTSLGLLAPTNAGARVVVAAAAGASCGGSMTAGKRTIALPAKKVPAKAGQVTLKSFAAGDLQGVASWKLHVTCTLKGKKVSVDRTLSTFAVVPDAPK